MKRLIEEFPGQLRDALEIADKATLRNNGKRPANVLIIGLGGSGIGGTIVADLCKEFAHVPIAVNKGYGIPNWVGTETLVIACSYSGNTEEVIAAAHQALGQGASIVGITSGGQLKELCKERGLNLILIPGANPPRSMLGYSLVQLLRVLHHYDVKTPNFKDQIHQAIKLLETEQNDIRQKAEALSKALKNDVIAVYAPEGYGGIATRWRQQINENSKMIGWDSEVPEMNHNELVGWAGGKYAVSAIFLRSKSDDKRNAARIELNMETLRRHTTDVHEIFANGESPLERSLYLIHLGDWLSHYLSEIRGCDILDITVINELKSALSNTK